VKKRYLATLGLKINTECASIRKTNRFGLFSEIIAINYMNYKEYKNCGKTQCFNFNLRGTKYVKKKVFVNVFTKTKRSFQKIS
jgi:hypothetical protein